MRPSLVRPLALSASGADQMAVPHPVHPAAAAHEGHFAVEGEWLVHRCAGQVRRVPVALVHAAVAHARDVGALEHDGAVATGRLRGKRAHHPDWGRWAVELRGPRWEVAWYPRGQRVQRVALVAATAHLRTRGALAA